MRVHLAGAGGHVRNAAAGEACRHALGIKAQIGEGEEAAIALAERGPRPAAKLREAQVLEVADDRAGTEALEELCLIAAPAARGKRVAAHVAAAAGATLVGQDDAEVLHGLLNPAVGRGREKARPLAARAALEEDEQWQVAAHVLGRTDDAVEELDALARGQALGGSALGLGAAPVERHVDGVVLNMKTRQVIAGE